MDKSPELEIALRRGTGDHAALRAYSVEMRFRSPDSAADDRLIDGDASLLIDPDRFNKPINHWLPYGNELRESFFLDTKIRAAFETALDRTPADALLRVRLYIEPPASELQRIHWEAMADPNPARTRPLFGNPRVAFSRYLNSKDHRAIPPKPADERLKALIVVSNPCGLKGAGLNPIPPEDEVPRVEAAFAGRLDYTVLAAPRRATAGDILAEADKSVDILCVVCHGLAEQRTDGTWESRLCLEKDDGAIDWASGGDLAQAIADLDAPPRLVVLASCQSAGNADSFVAAIGPQLAHAGIPAVLAMSGNLTRRTAGRFIPAFFRELLSEKGEGRIDRAVAIARGEVQGESDCWMPLLFTRLTDARIRGNAGESNRPATVELGRDLELEDVEGLTAIGVDAATASATGDVSVLRGAKIKQSRNVSLIGVRISGKPQ